MLRHAILLGVAGFAMLSRDHGCGGPDAEPRGVNAPCTRDNDCSDDLRCDDGVCTSPNPRDAGSDAATDPTAKDAAADG